MNGVLMPFAHSNCEEYVKSLLFILSDEQLKEELKRRDKERHSKFPPSVRCFDCKHCTEGLTFKHQVIPTTICRMKPKTRQGQTDTMQPLVHIELAINLKLNIYESENKINQSDY